MKRIALLISGISLCFSTSSFAGYDPNFRQMENMMRLFNPAFSGFSQFDSKSLLLNFRTQWMNLSNGNPLTFSGTWGGYFEKLKGAADFAYLYDKIGNYKNNWVSFKYSYRLRLGETSMLNAGFRASLGSIKADFGSNNPVAEISGVHKGIIVPDLDLGLMFNAGEKFFISASARHLTEPSTKFKGTSGTEYTLQQEKLTYHGMLGGFFKVGDHMQITCAADYRYSNSTGYGQARAEARWRFVKAGFYCILSDWDLNTNPYGFTLAFSKEKGRLHMITGFEPAFNSSFGSNLEAGLKYVFGDKD